MEDRDGKEGCGGGRCYDEYDRLHTQSLKKIASKLRELTPAASRNPRKAFFMKVHTRGESMTDIMGPTQLY